MKKNKKEKLILGQNKIQASEQMKFDNSDSRPDPSVEDDLTADETPFKTVTFPDAPEGHTTYEELLASEEYKHALDKLESITGDRNLGRGVSPRFAALSNRAMMILQEVIRAEMGHKDELEQLAERVIKEYFKLPDNALQFEFNLTTTAGKVQNKQSKEEIQQKEEELAQDLNDITPERAKRRLINAMTQGHAVDGIYIFNKVNNELQQITGVRNIAEKYSTVIALLFLGYWHFSPMMIGGATGGEEDAGAGKTRLDTTTDPPTIHAEGMMFPFLIHEAIKGVMEFLGKEKNPENPEKTQAAMEIEDQTQHEIWDIRLGPAIWRRLVKLFPQPIIEDEDKKVIQYYIYANIINLPTKEFIVLMKEIIDNSEVGKRMIDAMYYDISRKLDGEDLEDEGSEFQKILDDLTADVTDDDLSDLLDGLGISLN